MLQLSLHRAVLENRFFVECACDWLWEAGAREYDARYATSSERVRQFVTMHVLTASHDLTPAASAFLTGVGGATDALAHIVIASELRNMDGLLFEASHGGGIDAPTGCGRSRARSAGGARTVECAFLAPRCVLTESLLCCGGAWRCCTPCGPIPAAPCPPVLSPVPRAAEVVRGREQVRRLLRRPRHHALPRVSSATR